MAKSTALRGASAISEKYDTAKGELENYKLLVDSVEDYAIFRLDTDGNILTWNKGAQKIKGYTPNDIIGKHFSQFYREVDKKAGKPALELRLAKKQGRVEDEDWRVRKDGSTFWANVIITTLYDTTGKHIGFAKVTRDLTERKINEDALRRAVVALRKHQAELEQLNLSKDEFISLASHQLRTPVSAIKQLLGMLLEGFYGENIPAEILAVIEKAYVTNERQIDTINSLLTIARIDAGQLVPHKAPLDVRTILEDVVDEHGVSLRARHHLVTFDVPSEPAVITGDDEQLRIAIGNLVDNASKYTPGGGKIKIGLSQTDDEVKIYVSDNGVGVKPADIEALFDKFVRVPNELSQQVGGSGLGLYCVQKIIELHGGEVCVDSTLGKGTTFRIILPKKHDNDKDN